MVFSRFLPTTIFIPAENTRHSEKPGQKPAPTGTYSQVCKNLQSKLTKNLYIMHFQENDIRLRMVP
jgi:hypothetical protein